MVSLDGVPAYRCAMATLLNMFNEERATRGRGAHVAVGLSCPRRTRTIVNCRIDFAGMFFRGSESWTIALKRFNRTYGAYASRASRGSFATAAAIWPVRPGI